MSDTQQRRRHRSGSILERATGVFLLRFGVPTADGGRKQQAVTFRGGRKEAERELRRLQREVDTGTFVEPNHTTVGQFLDCWLANYAQANVSGKTLETYRDFAEKHLKPALGHHLLGKIQPQHVQGYYAQALESGRRDGEGRSVGQERGAHPYHAVVCPPAGGAVGLPRPQPGGIRPAAPASTPGYGRADRRADDDPPARGPGHLDLGASPAGRYHGDAAGGDPRPEVGRREPGRRHADGSAITGADAQGARVQVAQDGARAADRGPAALHRGAPDAAPGRAGGTSAPAWPRLQFSGARQRAGRREPHVPYPVTHAFERLLRTAGLPRVRLHALRHGHATSLLRQQVNVKVVSERLGHARTSITLDIYAHALPDMQQDAALKVDSILRGAMEESG